MTTNQAKQTSSLTALAIQAGKGEINWSAASENAAWDRGDCIRAACEAAGGPSEEQARAKALAMLADGTANLDEYSRLAIRTSLLLTDAASQLIAKEAQEALAAAEQERFEQECQLRDRKLAACEAIRTALGARVEQVTDGYSGFGSMYFRYRSRSAYGYTVDLRVSDHAQVSGGGWNEYTGERHGESDVSLVVNSPESEIPARDEIRKLVAEALRTARS